MDRAAFETSLRAEHYGAITTARRDVGYELGVHPHPFDACALITAGEITLVVDGQSSTYRIGDIFRLSAGTEHLESAGPLGLGYLVGRRNRSNR